MPGAGIRVEDKSRDSFKQRNLACFIIWCFIICLSENCTELSLIFMRRGIVTIFLRLFKVVVAKIKIDQDTSCRGGCFQILGTVNRAKEL